MSSPASASTPWLTLFYVANWHSSSRGNYFALTRPALTRWPHMWSLSIEEQFYIVWPPVALLMLHLGASSAPRQAVAPSFATSVVGAVASAVDMRLLTHGPPRSMRLYEGTDTRSQDILVGAALAIGMAIWAQHRDRPSPTGTRPPGSRAGRVPGRTRPAAPP